MGEVLDFAVGKTQKCRAARQNRWKCAAALTNMAQVLDCPFGRCPHFFYNEHVRLSTIEESEMADEKTPLVGIIMGSTSDMPTMEACMAQLDEFGVPYEVKVASAHRKPAEVHDWATSAHERGIRVIIAAAGKAAHLGGVVAAFTPCPVICVPMKTSDLGGLDSLLSMVQMPSGVPVACVAINGAKNAAILAVQMLGTGDDAARQQIIDFKAAMAEA